MRAQLLRHPIPWAIVTSYTMMKIDHQIRAPRESVGWYFRENQRAVIPIIAMLDRPFKELTMPAYKRGFSQKYVVHIATSRSGAGEII